MAHSSIWSAVVLAVSMVAAPIVRGQGSIPPGAHPPVAPSGSTVEGQEAEGRITRVDAAARTIRLDNGQDYVVPDAVAADWGLIRERVIVRIRYSTNEGRHTITALQVLFIR